MAYFKAYETVQNGKTSVTYYRGKELKYRIVEYDDGWFHALTSKDGGSLVPTLEIAKQRIEEHINLIDSMTGQKSRITYKQSVIDKV